MVGRTDKNTYRLVATLIIQKSVPYYARWIEMARDEAHCYIILVSLLSDLNQLMSLENRLDE